MAAVPCQHCGWVGHTANICPRDMPEDGSITGERESKECGFLGGTERGESNDCFLVECENNHRDHHTLVRLIKQHVCPGTVIITDGWRGYVNLSHHGYYHEDVNPWRNFVNPVTGAHTNTIEGCWFHVKRHLQSGVIWLRNDPDALATALAEVYAEKEGWTSLAALKTVNDFTVWNFLS